MRNYKNIRAWQLAKKLTVGVYKMTKAFPREELYGLTSQIRRAAASVIANIAEGSSRKNKRDYVHFLYISKGSLSEVECLIGLAYELGYLSGGERDQMDILCGEAASTLLWSDSVRRKRIISLWSLVCGLWSWGHYAPPKPSGIRPDDEAR